MDGSARWKVTYLNQQSDRATLIHFQNFTVLGPDQDVAVAKRYGTYGGVVLQQQPCGVTLSQGECGPNAGDSPCGFASGGNGGLLPFEPGAKTDLLMA